MIYVYGLLTANTKLFSVDFIYIHLLGVLIMNKMCMYNNSTNFNSELFLKIVYIYTH